MTADDLRNVIVGTLRRIAPEIDPSSIRPGVSFCPMDLYWRRYVSGTLACRVTLSQSDLALGARPLKRLD